MRTQDLIFILVLLLLIPGCGPKRPLQEVADAQIAIQEAKEAGAENYASERLKGAQNYFARALVAEKKKIAKELAQEAEVDARIAKSMTQRLQEKEEKEAQEVLKVKELARQMAEAAIDRARKSINRMEKDNREVKAAQDRLGAAREALKRERFQEAKEIAQEARELALEAKVKLSESHKVKTGETLKIIAEAIYGDPEKWELIYRANKDKIKNANIIYPGQILSIPDK
jgi:nucleoid-associated protein YgaU